MAEIKNLPSASKASDAKIHVPLINDADVAYGPHVYVNGWSAEEVEDCPNDDCSEGSMWTDGVGHYYCVECNQEWSEEELEAVSTQTQTPVQTHLSSEYTQANDAAEETLRLANQHVYEKNYGSKYGSQSRSSHASEAKTVTGVGGNHGYSQTGYLQYCTHRPQLVIDTTKEDKKHGFRVYAGKRDDIKSELYKFDVVLNLTWSSVREKHAIPIPELKKWESKGGKFKEIQLDWPDMGIVSLPRAFWDDLVKYLKKINGDMLVFCQGGHGRTGTAVAAMLVSIGWEPRDAVVWIREHYCKDAVETVSQLEYIWELAGQVYQRPVNSAYARRDDSDKFDKPRTDGPICPKCHGRDTIAFSFADKKTDKLIRRGWCVPCKDNFDVVETTEPEIKDTPITIALTKEKCVHGVMLAMTCAECDANATRP